MLMGPGSEAGTTKNIFRFSENNLTSPQITCMFRPSRSTKRGGSRSSRNAGRDAVDAEVPITNGTEADGEVVWF